MNARLQERIVFAVVIAVIVALVKMSIYAFG